MGERKILGYIDSDWIANTATIESMQFWIAINKRGLSNRIELLDDVEWWIQRFQKKLRDGWNYARNPGLKKKKENGDMAKSVDATDLIVLSLSMETC